MYVHIATVSTGAALTAVGYIMGPTAIKIFVADYVKSSEPYM